MLMFFMNISFEIDKDQKCFIFTPQVTFNSVLVCCVSLFHRHIPNSFWIVIGYLHAVWFWFITIDK